MSRPFSSLRVDNGLVKARVWIPLLAVVTVAGFGIAIARSNKPPDMHWAFLDGQRPIKNDVSEWGWAMDGPVGCGLGMCSDDGPAIVRRAKEYVYRADYKEVLAQANREALARGGVRFLRDYPGCEFDSKDKWSLHISPGKYDPVSGNTDDRAPYVQVTVFVFRKEDAFGVARRWIKMHL
jgi:hypothetical protein